MASRVLQVWESAGHGLRAVPKCRSAAVSVLHGGEVALCGAVQSGWRPVCSVAFVLGDRVPGEEPFTGNPWTCLAGLSCQPTEAEPSHEYSEHLVPRGLVPCALVPWCPGVLCPDALCPEVLVPMPWYLGALVPWCPMPRCPGACLLSLTLLGAAGEGPWCSLHGKGGLRRSRGLYATCGR